MNQKKVPHFIIFYTLAMLAILLGMFFYLISVLHQVSTAVPPPKTETIYVSEEIETPPVEIPNTPAKHGWIVKEHMGKIGIFSKDGTLLQILDTYVKTLPKADQSLLGEGLEIATEAELNAIIEDYSD